MWKNQANIPNVLFEINEQKNEHFKIMKTPKGIYYLVEEGHYGLKMILEFGWSGS